MHQKSATNYEAGLYFPKAKIVRVGKEIYFKIVQKYAAAAQFQKIFQPQKQQKNKMLRFFSCAEILFFFVKRILVNKLRIHEIFQKFCVMALWKDLHGRQSLIHKRISCVTSFPRQRNLEHLFFLKVAAARFIINTLYSKRRYCCLILQNTMLYLLLQKL